MNLIDLLDNNDIHECLIKFINLKDNLNLKKSNKIVYYNNKFDLCYLLNNNIFVTTNIIDIKNILNIDDIEFYNLLKYSNFKFDNIYNLNINSNLNLNNDKIIKNNIIIFQFLILYNLKLKNSDFNLNHIMIIDRLFNYIISIFERKYENKNYYKKIELYKFNKLKLQLYSYADIFVNKLNILYFIEIYYLYLLNELSQMDILINNYNNTNKVINNNNILLIFLGNTIQNKILKIKV
tara:strand:- start:155 stop:865 length:711 start_codon:yes stop_codon:yes gene_type:complete